MDGSSLFTIFEWPPNSIEHNQNYIDFALIQKQKITHAPRSFLEEQKLSASM